MSVQARRIIPYLQKFRELSRTVDFSQVIAADYYLPRAISLASKKTQIHGDCYTYTPCVEYELR